MKYRAFGTRLICLHHLFPVGIRNPFRLVRLAVEIHHHGMAQRLDLARFCILQALLHLETGIAYFRNATLAHNVIVEMNRMTEIKVDVDKHILECKPIDLGLEDMFEVAASTHVEEVALRPIIDVVIRVEVAHANLDGTREHVSLEFRVQSSEFRV